MSIISRAEAKAAGLPRYFTGLACKNGHVAERLVSGDCIECKRHWDKIHRERHEAKIKQGKKDYYENNKEAINVKASQRYYRDHESRLLALAKYREENKDALREYFRNRYHANKDDILRDRAERKIADPSLRERNRIQTREWVRLNKDRHKANVRNRKARLKLSIGKHTGAEIKTLLDRQKCKCANCQTSLKNGYHADHVMPLALGGSNFIQNIQLLCAACNLSKGARHPIEFAQRHGRLL
jgi:5-methylcytosine-specific restriction endonuclease McrA